MLYVRPTRVKHNLLLKFISIQCKFYFDLQQMTAKKKQQISMDKYNIYRK